MSSAVSSELTPASRPIVSSPAIVIGAGPAGLAVGACLARAGIEALILEQADGVASAWRRHYDRLHLHTAKDNSALPFLPFPAEYPRYASRQQVIAYLESYARHFGLRPRFGQRVRSACRTDGAWEIQTDDARYRTANLVVATGYNREPNVPSWPGQDAYRGALLHSSRYRNGEPFRGRRVLVVGFGNSGGEIAIDLHEHGAFPSLAVRGAVNVVPRELFGIPIQKVSRLQRVLPPRIADALSAPLLRLVVGDLGRYGLQKLPHGPATQIRRHARIPLIDVGTLELIKQGHITVRPGIDRFTDDGVVFADGRHEPFDAVILATGYRPRVDTFLEGASAACDPDGTPLESGKESAVPCLYFCGYRVSPIGVLREINSEAQEIARAIAASSRRQQAATVNHLAH